MRTKVDVGMQISAIVSLPREELATLWAQNYGFPPTGGIRSELLVRSAAWYLQAKRLGGFNAETRRLLKSAMARVEAKTIDRDKRIADSPLSENADALDTIGNIVSGAEAGKRTPPARLERPNPCRRCYRGRLRV